MISEHQLLHNVPANQALDRLAAQGRLRHFDLKGNAVGNYTREAGGSTKAA